MKDEEIIIVLIEKYSDNPKIKELLENIAELDSNIPKEQTAKKEEAKETKSRQINNARKILNNHKIMKFMEKEENIELIRSIIQEDDNSYENLCTLVEMVYGTDAKNIIQERPELAMRDIPNFDIFEEQIRETIGYGGVHTFLTYYMNSEHVITDMAQNPDLINYYNEFCAMTETFFPPSAIGLEQKLLAFDKHKQLIKQIVDSHKKEEYVSNLLLFLRDEESYSMISTIQRNENVYPFEQVGEDLKTETLEQLTHYKETRGQILKHYIDLCSQNPTEISRILMFKHFGIIKDSPGEYNKYDHKKFLEDYLTFNKTELTDDEVDLVELYSILEDINNPDILIQIDELLSSREDVVNPLKMKTIDDKVVENYKREYVDSLLTIKQAQQKVDDPEDKSYRYIYKQNGDICYPNYRVCSDGKIKHKDFVEEENGDRIYQYKGKNGEQVTVIECKDGTQKYEIDNVELNSSENTKFRGKISLVVKDGQIEEFFFPSCEEGEKENYGLRKNPGKNINIAWERYRDGYGYGCAYEYKEQLKENPNFQVSYCMGAYDRPREFRKIISNESGKAIESEYITNRTEPEYEQWMESVFAWRDDVEKYLQNLVQHIEIAKNQNNVETETYFEKVIQYSTDEFQLEQGDIEGFVLYGVNKEQLCVSMIRGGATSAGLLKNKLFNGKQSSTLRRF